MTENEIRAMNLAQVSARIAEIRGLIDTDGADLEALSAEMDLLEARRADLKEQAERRSALLARVAGEGETVRTFSGGEEKRGYSTASPEYRSAFLKGLLGLELTPEERSAEAFVHTTSNTANVLPKQMLDKIWDLVSGTHSIMGDITIYRTGTTIEVIKHTAIAQGAATTVSENAANDDEQNTFVKVTLSGKDFSKHVDISYALERMSVDSLESYLTNEIALELGRALAEDVITQIVTDMASGNKCTAASSTAVTWPEIAGAFGKIERAGNLCVYARRSTIYNLLVGLVDTSKRPIFQLTAQMGAAGTLLGAPVKVEDAVDEGVLLIGDASKVTYNMVQDIMIESDRDIKKHVTTFSGYARGSGALIVPTAFASLSVASATTTT